MRSIDITKLFETANNNSSPCGKNPQWGDVGINPPGSLTTTSTTTQIPFLTECTVLINYGEVLYAYIPEYNQSVILGNFAPGGGDIAHTSTKIWFYNGTLIYEYDLQLTPFYATFNRTINASIPLNNLYVGLHAIDNTTLITSDTSVIPNRIITLDISGSTAVETNAFPLPMGKFVSGDIILTEDSKVMVTTDGGGNCHLYQYDYPSGTLEVALDLGDTMIYPYGLYENNNKLFIFSGPGIITGVDLNYPYAMTEINNSGVLITGASQNGSCITKSLITTTTTTTSTSSTTTTTTTTII